MQDSLGRFGDRRLEKGGLLGRGCWGGRNRTRLNISNKKAAHEPLFLWSADVRTNNRPDAFLEKLP